MKINKENKKIIVWGLILFAIVFIVMYGQQFKLKQETGMFYINLLSGTHRQIEWVVETLENQTITETEFSALLGQIDALTSMTISSSNLYISTPEIIKNFRRTDSLVNNEEHRNEFIFYWKAFQRTLESISNDMRDYSENHFFNRAASNLNLSIRYRGAAYYNFLSRTPSGRDYTSKLDELINERFNEQLSNSETN